MLRDLVKCYNSLYGKGKVPAFGYNFKNISYLIDIDNNGNINEIKDIRYADELTEEEKKKNKQPVIHGVRYSVPDDLISVSNNICPNYLWGKLKYMVPLKDAKLRKAFDACANYHRKMLSGISSKEAAAISNYFKNAAPVDFKAFDIDTKDKNFESSYFAFTVNGKETVTDKKLLEPWEERTLEGPKGISLISGEKQILRLVPQPKIKDIKGGQSSKALISRDKDSHAFHVRSGVIDISKDNTSYNNGNLQIGWKDTFKYSTALSYLLNPQNKHSKLFGELTVIFWSEGGSENIKYEIDDNEAMDVATTIKNPEDIADENLRKLFNDIKNGKKIEDYNPTKDRLFHINGFMGNAGRILWVFDITNTLGEIFKKTIKYLDCIKTTSQDKPVPIWAIQKLTIKEGQKIPNEKNVYKQLLMTCIKGAPFPQQIVHDLLQRTREKAATAKQDFMEAKSNRDLAWLINKDLREEVSIIKGILIRNYKKGDEIKMALNPDNPSTAYQFGRLFAIAQLAITSKNKNDRQNMQKVKERWLRSAVETPGLVYAEFLKSAHLHNASIKRMNEILDRIDAEKIPKRFNQEEQLQWFLGYHQQTEAYWRELKELQEQKEEAQKNGKTDVKDNENNDKNNEPTDD